MQKPPFDPAFARLLFLTYAELVTNQRLRHGQAGFATDTDQHVIRDLDGNYHIYSSGGGGGGDEKVRLATGEAITASGVEVTLP